MTNTESSFRSREQWLRQTLELLASGADPRMSIDDLSRALGVTKGSFYWHFRNRAQFRAAMLEYWSDWVNTGVIERARAIDDPLERIRWIYLEVQNHRLARFETVMHYWATTDEDVAERVAESDLYRHEFATWMFAELGFSEDEARRRGLTFVALIVDQTSLPSAPFGSEARRQLMDWQLDLLTSSD